MGTIRNRGSVCVLAVTETTNREPENRHDSPNNRPPLPPSRCKQRADARRNRERVLAAARAQFAANGLEAQIDDIARAADVGVGTVYRHFPTKEALLQALAADRFTRLAEWAREALEAPDAWQGFCDYPRAARRSWGRTIACSRRRWPSGTRFRARSARRTS